MTAITSESQYLHMKPIFFQIKPLHTQSGPEDIEVIAAKAGKNGKFRNMHSNLQLERLTFCLVNVAT